MCFSPLFKFLEMSIAKNIFLMNLQITLLSMAYFIQSTCVHTPQQNGIAERKNRHILEVARSFMFASNVPHSFWGEAVLTCPLHINWLPSNTLNFQTRLSCLHKCFPYVRLLECLPTKCFGCTAFIHNSRPTRGKLDPKAIKCIFVGYSPS